MNKYRSIAATAAVAALTVGTAVTAAPAATAADNLDTTLTYLIQEEKVARDVYLTLADQYGVRQFTNIARAEQQHMDAVAALLAKYGIDNPTVGDAIGEFDNPDLQALYDTLVAKGLTSLNKAARVGIKIEKVDIKDIKTMMAGDLPADVDQMLAKLKNGSKNHLRAFRTLDARTR